MKYNKFFIFFVILFAIAFILIAFFSGAYYGYEERCCVSPQAESVHMLNLVTEVATPVISMLAIIAALWIAIWTARESKKLRNKERNEKNKSSIFIIQTELESLLDEMNELSKDITRTQGIYSNDQVIKSMIIKDNLANFPIAWLSYKPTRMLTQSVKQSPYDLPQHTINFIAKHERKLEPKLKMFEALLQSLAKNIATGEERPIGLAVHVNEIKGIINEYLANIRSEFRQN